MLKPYTRPYLPIKDLLNLTTTEDNSLFIYLAQIIQDQFDPRFKISRQQEFDGVLKKGGVIPFDRSKLPCNPNIIVNRFILTIKDLGTESERFKARWKLMGHTDQLLHEIANNFPMLMRITFRIILCCLIIYFIMVLWIRDVEQAYLQSLPLTRDIFTEAPPEANLPSHQLLKILLPHYGVE